MILSWDNPSFADANVVAGIDPGLDGAVAILEGDVLSLHATPVIKADKGGKRAFDLPAMKGLFGRVRPDLVVVEAVGPMPKQGVTSTFNFGMGYGCWIGILCGLGIPYQLVKPQQWQKAILSGTARDKQAAIEFVTRRFPGVSLLATPRSKVPHDGMADAACLALYARQLLNGR